MSASNHPACPASNVTNKRHRRQPHRLAGHHGHPSAQNRRAPVNVTILVNSAASTITTGNGNGNPRPTPSNGEIKVLGKPGGTIKCQQWRTASHAHITGSRPGQVWVGPPSTIRHWHRQRHHRPQAALASTASPPPVTGGGQTAAILRGRGQRQGPNIVGDIISSGGPASPAKTTGTGNINGAHRQRPSQNHQRRPSAISIPGPQNRPTSRRSGDPRPTSTVPWPMATIANHPAAGFARQSSPPPATETAAGQRHPRRQPATITTSGRPG